MQKVYINGTIGKAGEANAQDLALQFARIPEGDPVRVVINSVGGEVQEGERMIAILKDEAKRRPLSAEVSNLAASMASVIFLSIPTRYVREGAEIMIHMPWAEIAGSASELRELAEDLEEDAKQLAKVYADNTFLTSEAAKQLMDGETYFTAEQAVQAGFAQSVITTPEAAVMARLRTLNPIHNMDILNKVKGLMNKAKKPTMALALETEQGRFEVEPDDPMQAINTPAYLNDEPAPDGEYATELGSFIVADNVVVDFVPVGQEAEEGEAKKDDEMNARINALEEAVAFLAETVQASLEAKAEAEKKAAQAEAQNEAYAKLVNRKTASKPFKPQKQGTIDNTSVAKAQEGLGYISLNQLKK